MSSRPNQSKVAERISNSDMSLYIDAVKKDFVIKYSNKTMRINAKERTFSDLEALIFAYYRGTIRGITDTARYDSTYALSAKYAYNKEKEQAEMFKTWDPSTTLYGNEASIIRVTSDGSYESQHFLRSVRINITMKEVPSGCLGIPLISFLMGSL